MSRRNPACWIIAIASVAACTACSKASPTNRRTMQRDASQPRSEAGTLTLDASASEAGAGHGSLQPLPHWASW